MTHSLVFRFLVEKLAVSHEATLRTVAYVVGSFRDARLLGSSAAKVPRLAKVLPQIAFTILSR